MKKLLLAIAILATVLPAIAPQASAECHRAPRGKAFGCGR
jgi:hypothetical protein